MCWLDTAKGLLTPLIGVIALWVAYRQHTTARDQLRLDLYEKRFAVYTSVKDLCGVVFRTGGVTLPEVTEFTRQTREAEFLFGKEVMRYIDEMRDKALDLSMHTALDPETRKQAASKSAEITSWFRSQLNVVPSVFRNYLVFRK